MYSTFRALTHTQTCKKMKSNHDNHSMMIAMMAVDSPKVVQYMITLDASIRVEHMLAAAVHHSMSSELCSLDLSPSPQCVIDELAIVVARRHHRWHGCWRRVIECQHVSRSIVHGPVRRVRLRHSSSSSFVDSSTRRVRFSACDANVSRWQINHTFRTVAFVFHSIFGWHFNRCLCERVKKTWN